MRSSFKIPSISFSRSFLSIWTFLYISFLEIVFSISSIFWRRSSYSLIIFSTVCLINNELPLFKVVSQAQSDWCRLLATRSEVEPFSSYATLLKTYIFNESSDFVFDSVVEIFLRFDLELWRIFCHQIFILPFNVFGKEQEFFEEFFILLVLLKEFRDEVVEIVIFPCFWRVDHFWFANTIMEVRKAKDGFIHFLIII